MKSKKVRIYTTPACAYCKQAKTYFKQRRIAYEEIDVTKNDGALREMVKRTGHLAVPQIVINGKTIVGFNREEIEKIL